MAHRHGKIAHRMARSRSACRGPDLVIGHGIFLSDQSGRSTIRTPTTSRRLRDSGASVAHCLTVFARRGMVLNSIGRYRNAGITVGIGTDTFPHNMVDEIRLACYRRARLHQQLQDGHDAPRLRGGDRRRRQDPAPASTSAAWRRAARPTSRWST